MNQEERLEGAKKHLKGAVTRFLLDGGTDIKIIERIIGDIDLLIKRVQELEHDKEHLELIKERQEEEYRNVYEQNKRYREFITELRGLLWNEGMKTPLGEKLSRKFDDFLEGEE